MGVQFPSPTPMIERNIEIPENTNIIINDTDISTKRIEGEFCGLNSSKVEFIILDTYELTAPLEIALINYLSQLDTSKIAILFPGNGSKSVKGRLSAQTQKEIRSAGYKANTNTKREFVREGRSVVPILTNPGIPDKLISKILKYEVNTVTIIDDVVASGQTIQGMRMAVKATVRENIPIENNYNPDIRFSFPERMNVPIIGFSVFTWLLQKTADTNGFEVFPTSIYKKKTGKAPVNSLSTMLYDEIKGKTVASLYSEKYFGDPYEFKILLEKLKKL